MQFVLLAHPRTGSTLLALALSQHTRVRMFGELFNDDVEERAHAFRAGKLLYRNGRRISRRALGRPEYYVDGMDGATFLREEVFYDRDIPGTFAVGFKMFYEQARDTQQARQAWHYLASKNDIRVIHMRRTNLLASYVSLKMALRSGEWVEHARLEARGRKRKGRAAALDISPIVLGVDECDAYFSAIESAQRRIGRLFQNHAVLNLTYERDLDAAFGETINRVQGFLELPLERLRPGLAKQRRGSLEQRIANFEKLRKHFKGTASEAFFEDGDGGLLSSERAPLP